MNLRQNFVSRHLIVFALYLSLAVVALVSLNNYVSPASAASYSVNSVPMDNGKKMTMRWNPCQSAITYRVNTKALPKKRQARAVKDIRRGFTLLSRATGMKFQYKGATSYVPKKNYVARNPSEIMVSYVSQNKSSKYFSPLLMKSGKKYVSGTGGYSYQQWMNSNGVKGGAIGRGFVVLNANHDKSFKPGFGTQLSRGKLILHEIAHVVGLNHVEDKSQIMYHTLTLKGKASYRSGDRIGLQRLGRPAGCITVPSSIWKQI